MRRALRGCSLIAGLLAAAAATAGGPLTVRTTGEPFKWSTAAAIQYRTDNGPLSVSVTKATALTRVANMFKVWQDVPSAAISYTRAGDIQATGAYSSGDVDTLAEYNAVEGDCNDGNQSPIVFDANAAIFQGLGVDETSVIGFAGPCGLNTANGAIVSGQAVMNGLFQDGSATPVPDLTATQFDATFIHEFGHFSGLDHSQINVECASGACGADNFAGLPTMFPFLATSQQATLSIDDVAWISKLYPAGGAQGFNATHGTITGIVYFSDGETHAQLVNVVARRVNVAGTPEDESRTKAGSSVTGNRVRIFHGNSINEPDPAPLGPFGSQEPGDIGRFEIPLPPGTYTIEAESIDPQFTEGSSVGGVDRIDMPGTAPPPSGPITVTAGQTTDGHDIVLLGTPPRFDQFEGPGP